MSDREEEISRAELQDRVLYALLGPSSRLARLFGTQLGTLRDLAEMAYYHETKRQGMKMKEVAELMDVSISKVALLSRALKENFLREEAQAELPRRIEFMLWAQPLSLAKIKQVLTDVSAQDVNRAIRELLDEGRIIKEKQDANVLYRLAISTDRRVWDSWLARVDGLNNVLRNVTDAIYARFFTSEQAAFARTLTFRVRPEDLERLQEFYEKQLFKLVQELDAATEDEPGTAVPISLSVFWAPYDFLKSHAGAEEEE